MNQVEDPGVAEPDANDMEESENKRVAVSPLDPEVEAPINAAVHFDDPQETEEELASSDSNKDPERSRPPRTSARTPTSSGRKS